MIEREFQLATPEERQKLAQTPEKRETLHMFAVSLTQRGRGMVHNNSSNLTREPEPDGRRSLQRKRFGLAEHFNGGRLA